MKFSVIGLAGLALLAGIGAAGAPAQARSFTTGAAPTPPEVLQTIPEAPVFRDFLPQAVDLSSYFPAVGDQRNQGSCVGWATAYAARAYYAHQVEHRDTASPANIPSPAWLFNIIHLGGDCTQGAYIPDAMEVLRQGARSLADYPYDDAKCPTPLPPARLGAKDFRIDSYELVWDIQNPDLDRVKGALAKGQPVVILADLDASFFDLNPRQSVWRAGAAAKSEGGHAITLVGYDDAAGVFKFINSWSAAWGDRGFGRIAYDTFAARVYEGYVMHLPGDPEIMLADSDFVPDTIDTTPPAPPPFKPPLLVSPTDGETTRDIAALQGDIAIGPLACGRVDIGTDAEGNSVATGFVASEEDMARVQNALMDKVDLVDISMAPWPACEVQLTLAAALAESDAPQVAIAPEAPRVGEALNVGIETPGFASYLYAAYFSADGNVLSLAQPSSADLRPKPAHTILRFGDPAAGQAGLTIAPPVGDEMLLVVASERPLFGSAQADVETSRRYLSALREGLLSGAAGRVTATLVPVTTAE